MQHEWRHENYTAGTEQLSTTWYDNNDTRIIIEYIEPTTNTTNAHIYGDYKKKKKALSCSKFYFFELRIFTHQYKTPFGGGATNERARGWVLHVRNCVGMLPTDFHSTLLTDPYPNLGVIGPAVLEIWNRHRALAHVQGRSQFSFARHATEAVPINIPSMSAIVPAVLEIWNDRCFARVHARMQFHPNCDAWKYFAG